METADELKIKIKLIKYILESLCSRELNSDGRLFLNKLKDKYTKMLNNELGNT